MTPAMHKHAPHHNTDRGFSFLELIVALFVSGVVLLPLVALELQIEVQEDRLEVQARSLALARQKMEELMATPWDDLAGGTDAHMLSGERSLQRGWRVQRDVPEPGLTTITVLVRERLGDGAGLSNAPLIELATSRRES